MKVLLCMLFSISVTYAKTFNMVVEMDGIKAHEDIVVDEEKKIMTVTVGSVDKIPGACNSINLHDFKTKILAIKIVNTDECVLTHHKETLEGALESLEKYKRYHATDVLKDRIYIKKVPVTKDEALQFGGINVVEFCEGYKLYRGVESSEADYTLVEKKRSSSSPCSFMCVGWCFVAIH